MILDGPFHEKDWKLLRSFHDEMLHTLCSRIILKAIEISINTEKNPHERYLELYRHIKESDKIVARCFNDWRRSRLDLMIVALRTEGLMVDSHVEQLSDTAKGWLAAIESGSL